MILSKSKTPKYFEFPETFICNIPVDHTPLDRENKRDRCYCQKCLKPELDPSVYTYGEPISCHSGFPLTRKEYLGVYLKTNEETLSQSPQPEEGKAQSLQTSCQMEAD